MVHVGKKRVPEIGKAGYERNPVFHGHQPKVDRLDHWPNTDSSLKGKIGMFDTSQFNSIYFSFNVNKMEPLLLKWFLL